MSIPCKMRPVGVIGLPMGYTRVEYLESRLHQYINAEVNEDFDVAIWGRFQVVRPEYANNVFGGALHMLVTYQGLFRGTSIPVTSAIYEYYSDGGSAGNQLCYGRLTNTETGEVYNGTFFVTYPNQGFYSISLFKNSAGTSHGNGGSYVRFFAAKIYKSKKLVRDFIPCLDETGTPCMFDLVSRKPFVNSNINNTQQFIVGLTTKQARNLANLPVTTNGTLTVSLPWDAQWDVGVQNALDKAAAKSWIITVQYRDPEVSTTNIPISFLEGTGTQYIDTGIKSTPTSKWEVDYQSKKTSGTAFESVFGGQTNTHNNRLSAIIVSNMTAARFVLANNSFGGIGMLDQDILFSDEFPATARHIYGIDVEECTAYVDDRTIKGIPGDMSYTDYPVFVMARSNSGSVSNIATGKLYGVRVSEEGSLIQSQVPALSPAGTPCMYDSVSGQNFYNQGSGSFTVGFDTTEKAAISLSKLPVTTGGTLTVSLPSAAQNASTLVPAAIDIAKSRGWTIIAQYRED